MIIPIKCFTCGMVLADKYRFFCEEVRKRKLAKQINDISAKIDDLYSIVTKLTSIIESQTLVSATDILETDVRS